ncbi:secreted protein containing LamG-like jellyroll fold domain protein, partial [Candidatus Magnetomorum sp. HK-1]
MIFTLIIFLLSFYAVSQATMTPPGNTISFNHGVYVEVAYNSDMNPSIFTISCWAKVIGGENTWRTVVGSRDPNSISGYMIYAGAHNKWQFTIANGNWISLLSNDIIQINQWYHLAGVYDGNKAFFYIDGQLVKQLTATFVTNSNRPFRIGSQSDTAEALLLFNGQIDEMRLWRVALTAAQIQNNKNKILYGTETGLVAYYNFDQTSGTTLKDHSNNNHDGTLMSTPTWDTSGITLDQPTITTISASQIPGSTNATLTGSINPNNYTLTDIRFEYGTTSGQYHHNTVAIPATVSGTNLISITGLTDSLMPVTWYYRLTGKINKLCFYGQEKSIDITPPVLLTIRSAAQINNKVTLYGTINPANHVFTNLKFEYGPDTNYGNVIPVQQPANSGTQNIQVSGVIPLLPSGSYHYRLTGTTTEPFTYTSQDETFKVLSPPGNALNFTGGGYVALANADFSTINSRVTIEFWMSGDSSLSNDFTVFEATNSNNYQILSGRFSKATNSMYFDV